MVEIPLFFLVHNPYSYSQNKRDSAFSFLMWGAIFKFFFRIKCIVFCTNQNKINTHFSVMKFFESNKTYL